MELTDSSRTFSGELDEKALGYRRCRIHRGEFVRQGIARGYEIAAADKLTHAGDLERIRGVETEIHLCNDRYYQPGIPLLRLSSLKARLLSSTSKSHVDRSILDASPFLETSIRRTQVPLEASKEYRIERSLNISTGEVYGVLPGNIPKNSFPLTITKAMEEEKIPLYGQVLNVRG
jgi:dTDP-D-glucose 4,6-dehydratase